MNISMEQHNLLNKLRDTSGKDDMASEVQINNLEKEVKGTKRKNIEEESTLVSRRSSRPNAGTKSTRLVEMEQIGRKYATNGTTLIIEDEKEKSLKYIERSKKQRLQKYIETIEKKMAPRKIPLSFTKSIEAANIWIADEARKEKAKEISTKYTETAKKKNAPKTKQ